ncbi:hypothetical protein RESH_02217 [Rhodopirellula europaea SH398]|uniref:Uncharacterized protein n=1 Tax=Rhodopirellula europaea SH398 TaxID=1263868 RepID=M5S6T3_9BACT|nr:hypothetical protein RESH_02217 [Rhodopirellula europaea SH398]
MNQVLSSTDSLVKLNAEGSGFFVANRSTKSLAPFVVQDALADY